MKEITKNKKYVCYSGASTKIGFHIGVAKELEHILGEYEAGGTSSGSMVALVVTCGRLVEAEEFLKTLKITDFMTFNPSSSRGILKQVYRFFFEDSLLDQSALYKTIRKVVPKKYFDAASKAGKKCWIHSVNESTAEEILINVMELEYEEALTHIVASSSISPTTVGELIAGFFYIDGGHLSHVPTHLLMEELGAGDYYSVLARPEDLKGMFWHRPKKGFLKFATWKRYLRVQALFIRMASLKAVKFADILAKHIDNTTHSRIFAPTDLVEPNKGLYFIHDQQELMAKGKAAVMTYLKSN